MQPCGRRVNPVFNEVNEDVYLPIRRVSSLLTTAAALNKSVNPFSSPYIPDAPSVNEFPPPILVCAATAGASDEAL